MKYLILLFCICNIAIASELTFKEKLRPYIMKVVGQDWTSKILGEAPPTIKMPVLPKIDRDAKSTSIYKNNRKEKALSHEDARRFNLLYLYELYPAVRNSKVKPERNELAKWINVMNQGATREGVYRAIVLDNNYQGLENYEVPLSDSVIQFVQEYMDKYLAMKVSAAALEKISFFSAKRIVVGRSLDLMDSFPAENSDLYDWYALLSAELSSEHQFFWKNKIRKMKSAVSHKKWAQAVPIQHVKSELILKIHRLMNQLNTL